MKTKLTILLSILSFGIFAQNATWDYLITQTASAPVSMVGAPFLGMGGDDVGYFHTSDTAYIFEVLGSVPPVQNFTAVNQGSYENVLSWTSASSPNVMIAVNDINYFPNPTDGTSYSVGNQLTGSNATIIYKGNATTFTHTGLLPYTNYFYKIWSIDSLTNYSTGKTDTASTPDAFCMATVDTSSSFVTIKWDPGLIVNMDSFYIYRVTNSTYNKIGMVHAGATPSFNDLNTNPDSFSYSYTIKAKDSTGNYSGYSQIHTTIHLDVDTVGADSLYWNYYVGKPVWFYYIYRGNSPGNMKLVDSILPYQLVYYFVNGSWKYYQVAGYIKKLCGGDSLVFSNIFGKTTTTNITLPKTDATTFSIYPNPANKNVFLRLDKRINSDLNIEIYNNLGMKIYEKKTPYKSAQNIKINLSGFSEGIYYITVKGQGINAVKKLIIQ